MEKTLWLLFHLLPVVIHGNLFISDTESMSPSENCGLATPSINFNEERNVIDVDEKNLNLSEGQTMWVGYQLKFQSFFYKGCSDIKNIGYDRDDEILADPGQCYSFCQARTPYIGLMNRTCYCITSITGNKLKENCSVNCGNQDVLICGGDGHISIYEPVSDDDIHRDEDELKMNSTFCLAVVPNPNKYVWSNCITNYQYLCRKGDNIQKDQNWSDWATTMRACLSGNRSPVQSPISYKLDEGSQLWTGNVRSYGITNGTGVRQGFVTYMNRKLYLSFEMPTTPRRSLCNSDKTWTTASPETDSTISSTLSMGSSSSAPNVKEANEGSNKVAVYVAVPLVVILIIVFLGIVFFWMKRKRQTKNKSVVKRATNNPSYQASVRSSGKETHDYIELEPDASYATVEDTTDPQEDYDTTAQTQANRNVNNTGNEYNTFKDFLEDPYNHTEKANKQADDTYNHCKAKGKKDNGAYDKVNVGNATTNADGDNNGQGSVAKEDSYSHIEKRDYR